ncbi:MULTISPECIES: single-stranded-DNA-specific exonuclease RecJ [Staphylococcus]|uniref:Single-stranded-DNA-specific exonuclease RecJ n=1 Tax=Staphylococcus haemolyticus TaxID=1283 RepID=A0A2K0A7K7_STAHA|nr:MULTISPECIES: single-stranded-DNA-specific exonuclease RecJ [Staphylococcus]KGF27079.1 single-stranded-DNA exonuclease [Staphylococcus haemolyticus DNF00585]MCH4443921.1 single-stranded-DNA-specific exonuclease RecJ [Staphylococcus haemolyticus]MCH4518976.1 single-stranded-DNA-specific exonuclease RecJ [Staphylococcus haemolyticus]MCH4535040.1 single-stranded-DNA-specific exonuclease RecJ [Staphylococcus haemolyticus]MCI2943360.1 single-stranded-DNA-specific exonuclease RecJ [Staphylococcus
MIKSKYNWLYEPPTEYINETLIKKYQLTPIIKKLLESKSITDDESIKALLDETIINHDPWLLSDMEKAVTRINEAIDKNERILVYGDYDADGVTSTTILVNTLQTLGAEVGWYIPNRFSEGYGPNELAFRNAYDEGVSLIITVDNGIQGHKEIEMIQKLGVDVIVTDHHEIGRTLPEAYAIVHPMHPEYEYPFHFLCGAGVAYKLSQVLLDNPPNYFVSLAAIGTIADLVSMTDENRSIVKQGLSFLNQSCPIQIKALLNQAGYNNTINEETVGFIIGPRLNAVGRLEDASLAAELLMTEDEEEAEFLAEQVEDFNVERKEIVAQITDEALAIAEEKVNNGNQFLLLAKENWHEGVLGIVASKIVETYALPTLILNIDLEQNHAKGSARSIEQVSMFEILSAHQDLISKFGGHHMAAGMTMEIDYIEALEQGLNDWMFKLSEHTSLAPAKHVSVKLEENDISINNIRDIQRLSPFGTDFEKPLLEIDDNEVVDVRAIGKDKNHLKLVTGQLQLQSLFWKNGQLATQIEPGQPINLLGNLQINEWNGNQSPQFIIQDIATNKEQILDYRSKRKQLNIDPNDTRVAFLIHPKKEKLNHNYYYYGDKIDQEHEVVILRDLPNDLDSLKDSLKNLNYSQLYLVLQHQQSIYFDGMPSSNQFKSCFKALMTKKETNLEQEGMLLCQHLNVKPNILKFMLKVFYELGFVTEENGIIKIVDNADKQNIETSRVYQLRQSRMEVEKLLLYDDFTQLKTWIKSQKG